VPKWGSAIVSSRCLIDIRSKRSGYCGTGVFDHQSFVSAVDIADLAMPIAASTRPPYWQGRMCNEPIEPFEFDTNAQFIG
jgi:hypothetical protein